jgi:hypothetical protein
MVPELPPEDLHCSSYTHTADPAASIGVRQMITRPAVHSVKTRECRPKKQTDRQKDRQKRKRRRRTAGDQHRDRAVDKHCPATHRSRQASKQFTEQCALRYHTPMNRMIMQFDFHTNQNSADRTQILNFLLWKRRRASPQIIQFSLQSRPRAQEPTCRNINNSKTHKQ